MLSISRILVDKIHIHYEYLFVDAILHTLCMAQLFNVMKQSNKIVYAVPQISIVYLVHVTINNTEIDCKKQIHIYIRLQLLQCAAIPRATFLPI